MRISLGTTFNSQLQSQSRRSTKPTPSASERPAQAQEWTRVLEHSYLNNGGTNLKIATALTALLRSNSSVRAVLEELYDSNNQGQSFCVFGPASSGKQELVLDPFSSNRHEASTTFSLLQNGSDAAAAANLVTSTILRSLSYSPKEINEYYFRKGNNLNPEKIKGLISAINRKFNNQSLLLKINDFSSILSLNNQEEISRFLTFLEELKRGSNIQFLAAGWMEVDGIDGIFDRTYTVEREELGIVTEDEFKESMKDPAVLHVSNHLQEQAKYRLSQITNYDIYRSTAESLIKELPKKPVLVDSF